MELSAMTTRHMAWYWSIHFPLKVSNSSLLYNVQVQKKKKTFLSHALLFGGQFRRFSDAQWILCEIFFPHTHTHTLASRFSAAVLAGSLRLRFGLRFSAVLGCDSPSTAGSDERDDVTGSSASTSSCRVIRILPGRSARGLASYSTWGVPGECLTKPWVAQWAT